MKFHLDGIKKVGDLRIVDEDLLKEYGMKAAADR